MLEAVGHIATHSIPILLTGLYGAVYTSCGRTRNAQAAGHVLLGAAVVMSAVLGKKERRLGHGAVLSAVFVLALVLGLLFSHLEETYTETIEQVVDQYCAAVLGEKECGALQSAIQPVVKSLRSTKDAELHAWNRSELVRAMMIVCLAFIFISYIVHIARAGKNWDITPYNKQSLYHLVPVLGLSVWLGWIVYVQRRLQDLMPLYLVSQPGLDDIFNSANLYMRWIQSYLLLGFVFIVYSMIHKRPRISSAFLYAFVIGGVAVIHSVNGLYNAATDETWIEITSRANRMVNSNAVNPSAQDIQDEKTSVNTSGMWSLGFALLCVFMHSTDPLLEIPNGWVTSAAEFLVVGGLFSGLVYYYLVQ